MRDSSHLWVEVGIAAVVIGALVWLIPAPGTESEPALPSPDAPAVREALAGSLANCHEELNACRDERDELRAAPTIDVPGWCSHFRAWLPPRP